MSSRRRSAYFTIPSIVDYSLGILLKYNLSDLKWVEPSAGSGAFSEHLLVPVDRVAIDIHPEHPHVVKQDFLQYTFNKPTLVFGNPPFHILDRFMVKCLDVQVRVIAMVFPYRGQHQKYLKQYFALVESVMLPDNSFTLDGTSIPFKTQFEVWLRLEEVWRISRLPEVSKPIRRVVPLPVGWTLNSLYTADCVCVSRCGSRVGQVVDYWHTNQRNYFFVSGIPAQVLEATDFTGIIRGSYRHILVPDFVRTRLRTDCAKQAVGRQRSQ